MALWPLVVYNRLIDSEAIGPFIPTQILDILNAVFGNIEEFFQASSLILSFGIAAITYYIVCRGGNTVNINMKVIFIAIFTTAIVYSSIRFVFEIHSTIYKLSDGFNTYLDFAFVWAATIPLSFCYFASYLQLRHQISQRVVSSSRAQEAIQNIMIKLIQSLNISNVIIWTPLMAFSLLCAYQKFYEVRLGLTEPTLFILRISSGTRGFIHYIVLYVLFKDTQIYDFEYTPVEASPLVEDVSVDQRSFVASARYGAVDRVNIDDNSGIIGNNLGLLSNEQPVQISSSLSLGNSFTLGASP
ncbi:hypothetical protein HDV06_003425 [Boothiomyces sp. JEL0866]|nr:hypothetical protein HDV06_003377 [Boothiomyces sp. JEL0866]KAJ3325655.1 hypothetical protein HDV06_003425 [Boothiomyces sp. JEL0866]